LTSHKIVLAIVLRVSQITAYSMFAPNYIFDFESEHKTAHACVLAITCIFTKLSTDELIEGVMTSRVALPSKQALELLLHPNSTIKH
jgi:hypothetical protein